MNKLTVPLFMFLSAISYSQSINNQFINNQAISTRNDSVHPEAALKQRLISRTPDLTKLVNFLFDGDDLETYLDIINSPTHYKKVGIDLNISKEEFEKYAINYDLTALVKLSQITHPDELFRNEYDPKTKINSLYIAKQDTTYDIEVRRVYEDSALRRNMHTILLVGEIKKDDYWNSSALSIINYSEVKGFDTLSGEKFNQLHLEMTSYAIAHNFFSWAGIEVDREPIKEETRNSIIKSVTKVTNYLDSLNNCLPKDSVKTFSDVKLFK